MHGASQNTSSPLLIGLLSVLLTVMSLAGCSQRPVWYHSLKDQIEFKRDRYECENEAATYIIALDEEGEEDILLERVGTCLEVRGYERALVEAVPPGVNTFGQE